MAEEMTAEGMIGNASDPLDWYSADGLPYGHAPDSETDPWSCGSSIGHSARRCAAPSDYTSSLDLAGRPVLGRMAQRVALRIEGW